ncbi:MAG: glycosyltransferase family 39 protein [Steroidobacter sp.]
MLALAALKFLLHLAVAGNYGLFTDELYFFACGEHLAWGYVDMPPLTAVQAWAARGLFGDSLYGLHAFPALAGGLLVLLVGAIARELGGGRYAQCLAALAAVFAPGWLAMDSYLSMNSIELVLVASAFWIVIRMINTNNPRAWMAFGLLMGIGLLNKYTIILSAFAIVSGLLLTRQRKLLFNRWLVIGVIIALLIWLPNLIWMWQHHFPHLEQLANIRRDHRNVSLTPFEFLGQQIELMQPVSFPVWSSGLWLLLSGKQNDGRYRAMGLMFLISLSVLMIADSRVYYLFPVYSVLFAAGAVAVEQWFSRLSWIWLRPAYVGLLALGGVLLMPLAIPLLSPELYIKYSQTLHLSPPRIENRQTSALPQLFADRFGWPEMANAVAKAYFQIPEPERSRTAIFGQDFGQAGAIDFYGPKLGLPKAISGHLAYWYWGPRDYTGETMLIMGDNRQQLEKLFEQVEQVGEVGHPYAMASQHWQLFLCRHPRNWNLTGLWPMLKRWN